MQGQELWSLEKCVAHAMQNNIQVKQSSLNNEVDRINFEQSKYSRLPSLNAGATHGYNWGQTIDPFTNQFASDRVRNNNFFLSSQVTLFNGFQISNTIKQAEVDYEAGKLDVSELKNNIALSIAQSYLNILFNAELIRVAESQVSVSQLQVDRMQKMVDVGQMAIGSLYDIQSQLAADELQLTTNQNNLDIAKVNLMTLLQLSFTDVQTFNVVVPELGELDGASTLESIETHYSSALTLLPQVKAAESRMSSSDINLQVAKGGRMPSISMNGSLGTGYSGNNVVPVGDPILSFDVIGVVEGSDLNVIAPDIDFPGFDTKDFGTQLDDNFNQSLSLNLNIPIFNGLQISSNVQRAKVQRDIANLNYESMKNQVYQDVQLAHTNTVAALRQYQSAEKALTSMQQNFTNAEKRFEQSMINAVDFNDAKNRLTNTESSMIRAKYEYLFRKTILDFYKGKPIKL
jgi:outer membrane protein